jgi:hypothetical protein
VADAGYDAQSFMELARLSLILVKAKVRIRL